MKQLRRYALLLLMVALLVSLCSCGKKEKSEKINTSDYSRTIELETSDGSVQIVHSDKTTEDAQNGAALKRDDAIVVQPGAQATLAADGNKRIHVQENSQFHLEASGKPDNGKTRICLEAGGVLCDLEKPLTEGERFEIQTSGGTISMTSGLVRVIVFTENGTEFTLTEVFEGAAEITIDATGEKLSLKSGEAALIQKNGEKVTFVMSDDLHKAFWESPETTGITIGQKGSGSAVLDIPYSKLPKSVLEQLIGYTQQGRILSLPEEVLRALLETGHAFQSKVTKEATCTEAGIEEQVCALCGLVEEREIPALGHVEEELAAVAPDCTKDGLSAGTKCSVCGEVLTAQEVVPASGHTPVAVPGREATCVKMGLTEGQKCSVCGKWLVTQKNTPVAAHDVQIDEAVAASCTHDGCTQCRHCRFCGKVLEEMETVPALGHTPETIPAEASTCTETGLTEGSRCSVCGEILVAQKEIPAAGHTVKIISAVAPTCTKTGLTEGSCCSVCGEILTAQEEIPATGHTVETIPGYEPTCTETGLTEGERCTVCGILLKPQETIPALPHTPKTILGKYPTCFREGCTDEVVCEVCGTVLVPQEAIPMVPHVTGSLAGDDPTCTHEGRTIALACQVCGFIIRDHVAIPKLPHTPSETPLEIASGNIPTLIDGKAVLGTEKDEYCYCSATVCIYCGEILEVEYHPHAKGEETTFTDENGVLMYQCKCKYCKEIIELHPAES